VKSYFLLELYTCLHLTSQKLLDNVVGLHLNNQKNCPKIGNKAMNNSTMIIMHLHYGLEKLYSNTRIGWFETNSYALWHLSMSMMLSLCKAHIV
jgi:hypothetical protein